MFISNLSLWKPDVNLNSQSFPSYTKLILAGIVCAKFEEPLVDKTL